MGKFHITKINFNLGLNSTYHLFQVNDSHLIYTNNQKEKRWKIGKDHFAKIHNEDYNDYYKSASSKDIMEGIINYLNDNKASLVVLNGDIIDYYCKMNFNLLKRMMSIINTSTMFVCGNHEVPSDLYSSIALDNDYSFQKVEYDDLIVLGIDNSNKSFNHYQVEKLKEELKKNKNIIIFYHIPIKTKNNEIDMKKYEPYFYIDYDSCDKDSKEFISLLLESNNIKGLLCGHFHGRSTSYLKEGLPQYVTSSALIGYFSEIIIK